MSLKKDLVVSFSGGRTSAFMSKWLIDNKQDEYNLHFVFANTGLEHEKTLEFIDKCDKEWGLNLAWIEAVTHKEYGEGITYNVVNFETAARNGEPFKLLCSIEGVPNMARPICTDRLKGTPLNKFRRAISKKALAAIGIRVDEVDRMNDKAGEKNIVYPLISMRPTNKPEIINFFKNYKFDLEIPEHLGNCVTCWKKTDRKLFTIAKRNPEYFIPFMEIEEKYDSIKSKKLGKTKGVDNKIFRGHRSVQDIIDGGKSDFVEWTEIQYEEQLDLLGFDKPNGCSESCEAF